MRIAVIALDAHRPRASTAEVEGFLERLAHALDLAVAVHRNAIDDDHHRVVNRRAARRRSALQPHARAANSAVSVIASLAYKRWYPF